MAFPRPPFADWELVCGLECHVQLATRTKLFSPAPSKQADAAPNTAVDVVDVGLPGTLPVLNDAVIDMAVRLGLALDATVRPKSVFARKHYFYPDLPKGYQISQYDEPIVERGVLVADVEVHEGRASAGRGFAEKVVRITRAHLEDDAGKSLHVGGAADAASYVDYNRAGTPLLEVVTEPDLTTPDEAMAAFRALRNLVVLLGICDGNLEAGSMRADANVSVRKRGDPRLGTRTELKNINSPRFLRDAVEHEFERQVRELQAGRAIVQETRLWDAERRESRALRSKEDAHDYRYFPDPDLPAIVVDEARLARVRAAMPELPRHRKQRYLGLGLSADDAALLTSDAALAAFYDAALAHHASNPKGVANWLLNDVMGALGGRATEELPAVLSPRALGELVALVDAGAITGKTAKDVLAELAAGRGTDPAKIVDEHGWRVQRDSGALARAVDEAIAEHPAEWQRLKEGKGKVMGFFVGAVMKKLGGKADPKDVNAALSAKL